MPKQAIVRLQLDEPAKLVLDKLCDRRGMTQLAVLSRVVTWFGKQDQVIQASVLGLLSDETLGDLAALRHRQLPPRTPPAFEGGVRAVATAAGPSAR